MLKKTIELNGGKFEVRELGGPAELRRMREEMRKPEAEQDTSFVLDLVFPGDARLQNLGVRDLLKLETEIWQLTRGTEGGRKNCLPAGTGASPAGEAIAKDAAA
jgi:hypothetical protein